MAVFHNDLDEGVSFAVALEFESGAVGTLQLNSNRLWWRNYDRIELTGQGEYVVLDSLWKVKHYTPSGNHFTENYRDERSGELTGDAGSWREFASAIREDREPICNIHENVKTMELYQALYDAAMAGRSGVVYRGRPDPRGLVARAADYPVAQPRRGTLRLGDARGRRDDRGVASSDARGPGGGRRRGRPGRSSVHAARRRSPSAKASADEGGSASQAASSASRSPRKQPAEGSAGRRITRR